MTRQIDTVLASGHSTRLDGVRAAVTGGTSGLGLALVGELLRRGARVAFVARTSERVEAVARAHPGAHGIAGDVGRKDEIHPLALQIVGNLGGLDVLVNNASSLGPVPLALLADTECEDLELAIGTNVLGPFRLTRALLGALGASAREGRGSVVINISSDAAVNAYPKWGAYGASKAALHHMSRIWDEELAMEGIRVPVARSGRHGHAAARGGRARRRSVDAQAPGDGRARGCRCDRGSAPGAALGGRAGGSGRGPVSGPSPGDACMIAAHRPVQRPPDARLLVVDPRGRITHAPRSQLVDFLRPGDLVIANDAATLPASLHGVHLQSGADIEVRLAARASLEPRDIHAFTAVVFGAGDYHTKTEDRPLPPRLAPGDRLVFGSATGDVDGRRARRGRRTSARCDDRDAARPSPARAPPLRRFG